MQLIQSCDAAQFHQTGNLFEAYGQRTLIFLRITVKNIANRVSVTSFTVQDSNSPIRREGLDRTPEKCHFRLAVLVLVLCTII
jgi:hypothetical protein